MPTKLMLEGDELPYTEYCRLASLFPEAEVVNGTPLIRQARSVKTPVEIEMFRRSGIAHAKAYEQIPSVYRPGMTDIEFSIETRTPDASARLPRNFPGIRTQHGNIHG